MTEKCFKEQRSVATLKISTIGRCVRHVFVLLLKPVIKDQHKKKQKKTDFFSVDFPP